jgi:hypothetical protein
MKILRSFSSDILVPSLRCKKISKAKRAVLQLSVVFKGVKLRVAQNKESCREELEWAGYSRLNTAPCSDDGQEV